MKPFSAPSIHHLAILVVVVHPPLIFPLALFRASLRRHVRLMLPMIFPSASAAIIALAVVLLAIIAARQPTLFILIVIIHLQIHCRICRGCAVRGGGVCGDGKADSIQIMDCHALLSKRIYPRLAADSSKLLDPQLCSRSASRRRLGRRASLLASLAGCGGRSCGPNHRHRDTAGL